MDEKNLTTNESLELITMMISRTRKRLNQGSGNIFLFWGYLCVCVEILVYIAGMIAKSPKVSWLYFLIPIIGIPVSYIYRKHKRDSLGVVTYSDYLTIGLWNIVIWIAIASIVLSLGFFIDGFPVWIVMMLFAFFVVGFATSVQGLIIREKCLILGGSVGIVIGGILTAGYIAGAGANIGMFVGPLFVLTYILMFIIPGHILNHKAKKSGYERA